MRACSGCTQKVVLYGQTKEQTPNITLDANDIFLDLLRSNEKQKITTQVNEMKIEFTKSPIIAIGETESSIAA